MDLKEILQTVKKRKIYAAIFPHLFFIILAILVLCPLSSVFWPSTHDLFRYTFISYAFKDAFQHGVLYPHWLPDFCNGYGYPTFVFYQPGLFYFVLLFQLFGCSIIFSYHAALFMLFYTGFLGIYLLTGELDFSKDRITRFFAVILFALTPYIYVDMYVRGDLSELSALLLTPWPLYFLLKIIRTDNAVRKLIYVFITSLSLALMVYAHPLICIIYYPFFTVFASIQCIGKDRKQLISTMKIVLIAIISAVCMSAPYWLNAFLMKPFVCADLALSGYYVPENHFVYFTQLFSNFWGFGFSYPGLQDQMSFQLGLIHFIIATAGVICGYKNRKVVMIYGIYIIMIFLMTPASEIIWKIIPVISMLQFPWRIFAVIAVIQIICSMGISSCALKPVHRYILYGTVTLFALFWYHNIFKVKEISSNERKRLPHYTKLARFYFVTGTAANELFPRTANVTKIPRGNTPLLQISNLDCKVSALPKNSKYHLRYSLSAKKPVKIRINQYYFPGWRVIVSGEQISDEILLKNLSEAGLIQFDLQPGTYKIEAYYDGPLGWRFINVAALVPLLLFLIMLIFRLRVKNTTSKI